MSHTPPRSAGFAGTVVLALLLLSTSVASRALGQGPRAFSVNDDVLSEFRITQLAASGKKGTTFVGEGVLNLQDGTPCELGVKQKLVTRKNLSIYTMRSHRGASPVVKAVIRVLDTGEIVSAKVVYIRKVKLVDTDAVTFEPESDRWLVHGHYPLSEIRIDSLEPVGTRGTVFTGMAVLTLADGSELELALKQKLNTRRQLSTYQLKSLRGAPVKARLTFQVQEPEGTVIRTRGTFIRKIVIDPSRITPAAETVTLRTLADWVAFQDGEASAWTRVFPDTPGGDGYTLTVRSPDRKYGVALHGTEEDNGRAEILQVFHATVGELGDFGGDPIGERAGLGPRHKVTLTATGVAPNWVRFYMAEVDTQPISEEESVELFVRAGLRDLVAIEFSRESGEPVRAVIRRDVDVNADLDLAVDFDTETNVPSLPRRTVTALGAGEVDGRIHLITVNGTEVRVGDEVGFFTFSDGLIATDLYRFNFTDELPSGSVEIVRNLDAATVTDDQSFDLTRVRPLTGTTADLLSVQGLSYAPGPASPPLLGWGIEYEQEKTGGDVNWGALVSTGWLGDRMDYFRPDFSAVEGFQPEWEIQPGITVETRVAAGMANLGLASAIGSENAPGLVLDVARQTETFEPGVVSLRTTAPWVYFQDGPGGAWVRAEPEPDEPSVYRMTVTDPAGRYGVVLAHPDNGGSMVHLIQATLRDGRVIENRIPTHPVDVTVTGVGTYGGDYATVVIGEDFTEWLTNNVMWTAWVDEGMRDLLAVETDQFGERASGAIILRDIDVSGPTDLLVDFATQPVFSDFRDRRFTVRGGEGTVFIATKNGTVFGIGDTRWGWGAATEGLIEGDLYAFEAADDEDYPSRVAFRSVPALPVPGNQTLDLRPIAPLTGTTAGFFGVSGLSYTPAVTSPPLLAYFINIDQGPTTWEIRVSADWLGAATEYAWPTAGDLPGLDERYALRTTAEMEVELAAGMSRLPVSVYLETPGAMVTIPGLDLEGAVEQHTVAPISP